MPQSSPLYYYSRVGLEPAPQTPEQRAVTTGAAEGVVEGFKRITPGLILVAIATGASFAIGNWIAHRYVIPKKR